MRVQTVPLFRGDEGRRGSKLVQQGIGQTTLFACSDNFSVGRTYRLATILPNKKQQTQACGISLTVNTVGQKWNKTSFCVSSVIDSNCPIIRIPQMASLSLGSLSYDSPLEPTRLTLLATSTHIIYSRENRFVSLQWRRQGKGRGSDPNLKILLK